MNLEDLDSFEDYFVSYGLEEMAKWFLENVIMVKTIIMSQFSSPDSCYTIYAVK